MPDPERAPIVRLVFEAYATRSSSRCRMQAQGSAFAATRLRRDSLRMSETRWLAEPKLARKGEPKAGGPEQRELEPSFVMAEPHGHAQKRRPSVCLIATFLPLWENVAGNFRHLPPFDVEAASITKEPSPWSFRMSTTIRKQPPSSYHSHIRDTAEQHRESKVDHALVKSSRPRTESRDAGRLRVAVTRVIT
jgi:hypothetical protein